jgi:hypothetical protein
MLAPELAALLAVMSFVLLFVCAAFGFARFALAARTENIARAIGACAIRISMLKCILVGPH